MSSMLNLLHLLLAVVIVMAGSAVFAANRPNVLFLLTDDQRPDTIHALGNPHIQTPHLDRLVREGTSFRRCVCGNPICTPSRGEILTGCSGFRNGVLDFGQQIKPGMPRWAATMKQAGYHTWYVGKWHNDGRPSTHGYEESQGLFAGGGGKWAVEGKDANGRPVTGYRSSVFQTDDGKLFPELGVGLTPDISARFADAAIQFIQRKPDRPFFLHVNFTAPHDPLLVPPGYQGRYDPARLPVPANFLKEHPFDHGNFQGRDEKLFPWPRTPQAVRDELAVYYAVIDHLDRHIGRVLQALQKTGQDRNTIVIFASDHGLAIGSHGLRGKQNMYEHTVNVPLILRGPGVPKDKRLDAQCYLRDLFPTACELCGIAVPRNVQGKSLTPLLKGEQPSLYSYTFCYFREFQRMVRTERWKLIRYPKVNQTQLFDLKDDPHEMKDLAGAPDQAARLKEMTRLLEQAQKDWGDGLPLQ